MDRNINGSTTKKDKFKIARYQFELVCFCWCPETLCEINPLYSNMGHRVSIQVIRVGTPAH